MKLLIAGDQVLHDQVKILLAKRKNKVICFTCASTEEALRLVQENQIDHILLDPCLPGLDVSVLLQCSRSNSPAIKKIVVLEWERRARLHEFLGRGADDYIYKPLSEADFFFCLESPARTGADLVPGKPFYGRASERKQQEKEAYESEARLRRIAEGMLDVVSQTDLDGYYIYVSPSIKYILGYDEAEIVGKLSFDLIHPDEVEKFKATFHTLILTASPKSIETRIRHAKGSYIWAEVSGCILPDENGSPVGIVFVTRDVTDRKKRDEEYLKASKLESVGILASGIAHDFNNCLAVILANIFLARLYLRDRNMLLEKLGEVEKVVQQAKRLSTQLLTFAKESVPLKKAVYVQDLIKETASLVLSGSNIGFELSIPGQLLPVEVDEGQISQAINNIMINAMQAMPNGGTIRVKLENVPGEGESYLRGVDLPAENYVKITIADQGCGILEEHLAKIFDPFFTTKPEGSGLGLAITYSVITKHNGHIRVDSKPGQGTTFFLYLPAFTGEIISREVEKKSIVAGQGRILLMDDNKILAEITSDLLAELGYQTEVAGDGQEALELYRRGLDSGRPYDVVIMDLTVAGGMGGKETMQKLMQVDPGVKAIVSTGYTNDPVAREYSRYGFKGFIAKPSKVEDLAREINRILRS